MEHNNNSLNGQLSPMPKLHGQLSSPESLYGFLSQESALFGVLANATLRGYSAYQCALETGYEGTEEEWIASLKGKTVELRANDKGEIEWKYTDEAETEWKLLFSISVVSDYNMLGNKPSINGQELIGDTELNYVDESLALTNTELDKILI
jgi:hypothetical protein